jgi:hypothetical protein
MESASVALVGRCEIIVSISGWERGRQQRAYLMGEWHRVGNAAGKFDGAFSGGGEPVRTAFDIIPQDLAGVLECLEGSYQNAINTAVEVGAVVRSYTCNRKFRWYWTTERS